ncbi:hypothetical protein [Arhodomonas sp. AD133]|uniref:hypothetical protein n=1 Tax=Arhodomonas sp. AD133 TaxID=3415009 RepID=UPI003EB8DBB2
MTDREAKPSVRYARATRWGVRALDVVRTLQSPATRDVIRTVRQIRESRDAAA